MHGAVARLAERAYERLDPERRPIARRDPAAPGRRGRGRRRRAPARVRSTSSSDAGAAEVLAVLADGRLRHGQRGRGRGRARGAAARVAAPARLARGGRPGPPPAPPAPKRRTRVGRRRPRPRRAVPRRAAGLDAGLGGRPRRRSQRDRAGVPRRRAGPPSERSQRRLRAVLAGVAALLVLAVIAGVVALDQRGSARDEADRGRRSATRRPRACSTTELDRSLLLARQGVRARRHGPDARATCSAPCCSSPAAIGVMRADRATILSAAAQPRRAHARRRQHRGPGPLLRHADPAARRHTCSPAPNHPGIFALAYSPDGSRLAVAHTSVPGATAEFPRGWRVLVALVDARTRRVARAARRCRASGRSPECSSRPTAARSGSRCTAGPVGRPCHALRRADGPSQRRPRALRAPRSTHLRPVPALAALTRDVHERRAAAGGRRRGRRHGARRRDIERAQALPAGQQGPIRTVPTAYALSGDDRTVAIGGEDGSLRLLDLTSGKLPTASGRHRAAVNEARFTPDRRTLVTTSEDGDVILWDVRQAAAAETLSGHARSAFSPQIARRRQDALHRQPRRHGADLGSRWPPPPGRPLHGGAPGRPPAATPLSSDGRVARARAGRRRDQPRRHAHADTAAGTFRS